jgi:hypothetical protein
MAGVEKPDRIWFNKPYFDLFTMMGYGEELNA